MLVWELHERDYDAVDKLLQKYGFADSTLPDGRKLAEVLKGKPVTKTSLDLIRWSLPSFPLLFVVEKLSFYKPPVEKPDNTEYHRELEKLRGHEALRKYNEMVRAIDPCQKYGKQSLMDNFGQEMKTANRHLIVVLNTLLTVGGAFAFGFFGINYAYPHLNLDVVKRMIIGLVLGIVVFFADLYFIVKGMGEGSEAVDTPQLSKVDFKKSKIAAKKPSSKLPVLLKTLDAIKKDRKARKAQ